MTDFEHAILSTDAMAKVDAYAIKAGVSGPELMEAAGKAVSQAIVDRWAPRPTAVLCGPGNNGGDGWVAARYLRKAGWPVTVFSCVDPNRLRGDALWAAEQWVGDWSKLEDCEIGDFSLVVDALFGAGLNRPLDGVAAAVVQVCDPDRAPVVVSIDVPSGVNGDMARAEGSAFHADLTVTFHRYKPLHLLQPAASLCGERILADIGVPHGWGAVCQPLGVINHHALWDAPGLIVPPESHKHKRGRLCILSGLRGATGAARLSGQGAQIAGAGFVTLLCGQGALNEAASASASLVMRGYDNKEPFADILQQHRAQAAVLGPGAGLTERLKQQVVSACTQNIPLVIDADAISVFEEAAPTLFTALHEHCVLTPHRGEFARLFPDLDQALSAGNINKITAGSQAAERAGAHIVFKGPDTIIAAPDGRVRVNVHASARLAVAGTGDVLAGMVAAFAAQGADCFDAASAAVWLHGDAGRRLGPGDGVQDLLSALPLSLRSLRDLKHRQSSLKKLTSRRR